MVISCDGDNISDTQSLILYVVYNKYEESLSVLLSSIKMGKSPVWDFQKSPKIEIAKSQLDRLVHDENYVEKFTDWINDVLQHNILGKTISSSEAIPSLVPRPDSVLSRLVGVSVFDQISQIFSSDETKYIVQINDEEVKLKVEALQNDAIPLLMTILNGNLNSFKVEKRLHEADAELQQDNLSEQELVANEHIKQLLQLIKKAAVNSESIDTQEWLKNYTALAGCQLPQKTSVLIEDFDFRIWQRSMIDSIVTIIEAQTNDRKEDETSMLSSRIQSVIEELAIKKPKSYVDLSRESPEYIFECDLKFPFALNCSDDVIADSALLLQDIKLMSQQKSTESKELMLELTKKLRSIADGKAVVYENLLQLFQSSKDTVFAQHLTKDIIPNLTSMSYSSYIVNNWRSLTETLGMIRLKMESINPSSLKLHDVKTSSDKIENMRNKVQRRNELEKRCCFNRLMTIFGFIESRFESDVIGLSIRERLHKLYFSHWKMLQDVIKTDEKGSSKIFCRKTILALQLLVSTIQGATEILHFSLIQNRNTTEKLQSLSCTWVTISDAIISYLTVLEKDQQTLPLLLDNQIFQIHKAHALLPVASDNVTESLSKLSFKIYTMQLFFEDLLQSALNFQKNLKNSDSAKPDKKILDHTTEQIIDEIKYREKSLTIPLKRHENFIAAHHVLCDTIIRHISWYFCVGSADRGEERYNIDFILYDTKNKSRQFKIFDNLPDLKTYVVYMRQFIAESNRSRKTATFKVDFFKMIYTQILSNFHSIASGIPGPNNEFQEFLNQQFQLPSTTEKTASVILNGTVNPADELEQIRLTPAFKQLINQYSYDKLVQSWSIDALDQTDFNRLTRDAKKFFDIVQQFYYAIFKKIGGAFTNTTIPSLCRNLSISDLVNLLKNIVPDWHTEEMCESVVWSMLNDESARTSLKRTIIKDVKTLFRKIRTAGGPRQETILEQRYVCASLEKIKRWADEGGSIDDQHREHLDLLSHKCRLQM